MRALIGTLLLAFAVGGCARVHPQPETYLHEGPLRIADNDGGLSIERPSGHAADWWATVGGILLCSTEPVQVLSVVATWKLEPTDVRYSLRTWRPTRARRPVQDPIASAVGTPPSFAEEYAQLGPIAGRLWTRLSDAPVTSPCPKGGIGKDLTELLISVHVDRHGADFHRLVITYLAGGRTHRRLLDGWQYIACGDRVTEPKVCPPGQHAPGVPSSANGP